MEGESISSFFPPQCWLLLAAHVANSPQIKLNIQIDKVVHATFKFTESRQSQIKLIQDSMKYYITDGEHKW